MPKKITWWKKIFIFFNTQISRILIFLGLKKKKPERKGTQQNPSPRPPIDEIKKEPQIINTEKERRKRPVWENPPKDISFTKKTLFKNPDKKINSLQKKALEILFIELNLSVEEYGKQVAYFPSRLLAYIEKKDSFSALRDFFRDIGVTPEKVLTDKRVASFVRDAIFGLYEADLNCWDTPLSTEFLYQCLVRDGNLDNFNNYLGKLEKFTTFVHKLQRLSPKISFYLFKNFTEKVFLDLNLWHKLPVTILYDWSSLLEDYELAYDLYQNYWSQIKEECDRLDGVEITPKQTSVVEALLKEIEQIDQQLRDGSIEIAQGLNNLEILADELKSFIDEILHRTRERTESRTDSFRSKSDKMSPEEALKFLDLTFEELSHESLKMARRRYAKVHHPDAGGNDAIMKKVNEAYETLREFIEKS